MWGARGKVETQEVQAGKKLFSCFSITVYLLEYIAHVSPSTHADPLLKMEDQAYIFLFFFFFSSLKMSVTEGSELGNALT